MTDRLPFGGRRDGKEGRRAARETEPGDDDAAGLDGSSVAVVRDPHDAQLATETTSPARPANYVLTRLALARLARRGNGMDAARAHGCRVVGGAWESEGTGRFATLFGFCQWMESHVTRHACCMGFA